MLRRLIAAALVVLAPMAADWSGVLRPVENQLTALRMEAERRPPTGAVVVVDIDAKSIGALGSWPWPRRTYAELIDKLDKMGAGEIAFDVDFSAPSNPVDDGAMEAALKRAGGSIILAAFVQKLTAVGDSEPVFNHPVAAFAANAWMASVTVRPDSDGLVRRFPYGIVVNGQIYPSVPAVLAGGLGEVGQSFAIDFSINLNKIDRIPVVDVLNGVVDPARIAGKKVIVGAQAVELRDFFSVPVAGTVSGALLQAGAAETLIQGRVIHATNSLLMWMGLLVIGLATLVVGRVRWTIAVAGLLAAGLITEIGATFVQARFALAIDTAPWLVALAIFAIVVLVSEIDFGKLVQTMWRVRASNAEALLGQVVTDNFAGIVVVDKNGRIRAASRTASELLGAQSALTGLSAYKVLPAELAARVDSVLTVAGFDRFSRHPSEYTLKRPDGKIRTLEYIITVSEVENERAERIRGARTYKVACLTFTDVTNERAAKARIERMARFDTLTDLPNRNQLIERLESAFTSADHSARTSAVVSLDLDGFKSVNDTLGHHIGDLLLREVAARATALLPPGGLVARLGADEFAAVISGPDVQEAAVEYATEAVAIIGQAFHLEGHQVLVGASAGVALADARDKGPDDILKRADIALYRAKAGGGNTFVVFEREMLKSMVERQRLEVEMWRALERGEFEVWYQPQVDLATGRLAGVEALLRWHHPKRGMVSPAEFVPVAEAIGMIEQLGQWVLETACADVASWSGHLRLAVNVSSVQFTRGDMARQVADALKKSGLPARQLDLEITESVFMHPSKAIHESLAEVRALGVGVALDDFGTGYSSLSYLQKFPITKIKLDQSFVAELPANGHSASIVRAVASLAHDLKLKLNAEGIENAAQAAFLRSLDVSEGQGYLFGQAQRADDMARLINSPAERARLTA